VPSRSLRPVSAAALLALGLAAAACSRPSPPVSAANTRAHLNMIAGTIGTRPAGTDAARRARDYIVAQLEQFGFHVRLQTAETSRPEAGLSATVTNIIAVKPGQQAGAIGLVSHYDSVWRSPGAADDGFGVAVSLEAARLLAARPAPKHSLMVLVTDAEEAGLLGATALIRDPEVGARLKTYINLEAIGTGAPSVLFETGPANDWLLRPWSVAAPRPRGASYHLEIYRRLPNDTDFSILKRANVPGLNIAAVGNSYAYHTPLDTPERVPDSLLLHTAQNVVATVNALDSVDLDQRSAEGAIYFDLLGRHAVTFSARAGRWFDAIAIIGGLLALVRIVLTAWPLARARGILVPLVWGLMGAGLGLGAMTAVAALLRSVREVYHPWYASPGRFFALLVLSGLAGVWAAWRLGIRLPARWRPARHPVFVWFVTLPVWIALTALAAWHAPSAAYLWTLPLLTAAVFVGIAPDSVPWSALSATIVTAVAAVLWLPDALDVMPFLLPVFGRLPIVTPIYVLPAVVAAIGIMTLPPLIALLVSTSLRKPRLATRALIFLVAVLFGASYTAPAYTPERPQWRTAQYISDLQDGRAYWELGSIEPGLDVLMGAGGPQNWRPWNDAQVPWSVSTLSHPFRFRADVPAEPASLDASTSVTVAGSDAIWEIAVRPPQPGVTLALWLPRGVTPRASSHPGSDRGGRWVAGVAAAPSDGVRFRITLPVGVSPTPDARIAVIENRLPGQADAAALPSWLSSERTVWRTRRLTLHAWPQPAPATVTPAEPALRQTP
jgi:Peptidase family M28